MCISVAYSSETFVLKKTKLNLQCSERTIKQLISDAWLRDRKSAIGSMAGLHEDVVAVVTKSKLR